MNPRGMEHPAWCDRGQDCYREPDGTEVHTHALETVTLARKTFPGGLPVWELWQPAKIVEDVEPGGEVLHRMEAVARDCERVRTFLTGRLLEAVGME